MSQDTDGILYGIAVVGWVTLVLFVGVVIGVLTS